MAEDVVKTVRLLEVIELRALADEVADRKHAPFQHREEVLVRDQAGDRDAGETGERLEPDVELAELGNARMTEVEHFEPAAERIDQARPDRFHLPSEQHVPHGMILVGEMRPILWGDMPFPAGGFVVEGKRAVRNHLG